MRKCIGLFVLLLGSRIAFAQVPQADSLQLIHLPELVIEQQQMKQPLLLESLSKERVGIEFLKREFKGNFVESLEKLPGVHAMSVGSGFSKPMIRGQAFQRISVVVDGIKQEGQQWGADHGLEIDPFGVEQVTVIKGPASLLYGSDAMGGVIEVKQTVSPKEDQLFGEGTLLYRDGSERWGGSLLLGGKRGRWYGKVRYSEQQYADYRVPTDTVVYLTQRLPIANHRLKNTAGVERSLFSSLAYQSPMYRVEGIASLVYQKMGMFPGAHGIPSADRLTPDGNRRDIDFPYNRVSHLRVGVNQRWTLHKGWLTWSVALQNNHRQELSLFHTHYGELTPPKKDPNLEFDFNLTTSSSDLQYKRWFSEKWSVTVGNQWEFQENGIKGYSFLLPRYKRATGGGMGLLNYTPSAKLSFALGVRTDWGKIKIDAFRDDQLATYLEGQGYEADVIERYAWRSRLVDRDWVNFSTSLGMVWKNSVYSEWKWNLGRSFRLPTASELGANGIHHGTFRHEQGDASLQAEQGWQLDASYSYAKERLSIAFSPFVAWYNHYIYLRPTGEWSILPHAGQIYRYTDREAILAGAELSLQLPITTHWSYGLVADYLYTVNRKEHLPLSFTPPFTAIQTVRGEWKRWHMGVEYTYRAAQKRVDRNEQTTASSHLIGLSMGVKIPLGKQTGFLSAKVSNLFDRTYFNHLSFYRKMEIPEAGRDLQLTLRIPFSIYSTKK